MLIYKQSLPKDQVTYNQPPISHYHHIHNNLLNPPQFKHQLFSNTPPSPSLIPHPSSSSSEIQNGCATCMASPLPARLRPSDAVDACRGRSPRRPAVAGEPGRGGAVGERAVSDREWEGWQGWWVSDGARVGRSRSLAKLVLVHALICWRKSKMFIWVFIYSFVTYLLFIYLFILLHLLIYHYLLIMWLLSRIVWACMHHFEKKYFRMHQLY